MFTDAEKIDMDYFSIVSQQVAEQLFVSDKEKKSLDYRMDLKRI